MELSLFTLFWMSHKERWYNSRDLCGEDKGAVAWGGEEARVDVANTLQQFLHLFHLVTVDHNLRHLTVEGDGLLHTHTSSQVNTSHKACYIC